MIRRKLATVVLGAALLVGACGGDEGEPATDGTTEGTPPPPPSMPTDGPPPGPTPDSTAAP